MTTSGITDYSVTRNDIIEAALADLHVLAPGEDPTPEMLTQASLSLNMMIKAWQGRDIGLWLNRAVTVALLVGQTNYKFGPLGATGNTTRPLDFIELRVRDASGSDTPVELVSRDEYMTMTLKTSSGTPNIAFYDPQLTNGVLYVWPVADDATKTLQGTVKYPIQIFNTLSDNPEFPVEWYEALEYNLALRLAPKYQVPMDLAQGIAILAKQFLNDAEWWDREHSSVRFAYRSR